MYIYTEICNSIKVQSIIFASLFQNIIRHQSIILPISIHELTPHFCATLSSSAEEKGMKLKNFLVLFLSLPEFI